MMTMTNRKMTGFPRLRWWLPVLACMMLSPGGCADSGSTPSGPGDDTPLANEGRAGITARGENSAPGGSFTIVGYFNDGSGRPVEGVQIVCGSESSENFTFGTNPTLTAANGGFSVNVDVGALTPPGSYTFTAQTGPDYNGPHAIAYVHIMIEADAGVAAVTAVTLITLTPTVELVAGTGNAIFTFVAVKTASCTLVTTYAAVGSAGYPPTGTVVSPFSLTVTAVGTLAVQVTASCAETPTITVLSSTVTVTVQDLVPG